MVGWLVDVVGWLAGSFHWLLIYELKSKKIRISKLRLVGVSYIYQVNLPH